MTIWRFFVGRIVRTSYLYLAIFPAHNNYMNDLNTLMQSMEVMEIIYWAIAAVATVIFLIQATMLVIGFDTDADMSGGDAAFDADGVHLLSVKTIVCFLLGFGWTGAIFYPLVETKAVVGLIAVAVGVTFMFLIAFLMTQVMRLSKDNTFTTDHAIDKIGEVYLRIPGGDEAGKVMVSHLGSMHELTAFSDAEIPTGTKVRITAAIDPESVRVERISAAEEES